MPDARSPFDRFIEARFELLRRGDQPLYGDLTWKALVSPRFWTALLAGQKPEIYSPVSPGDTTIAGIPFCVAKDLRPGHLAVLFSGRSPFDPAHPERTVVIEEESHASVAI